MTERKIFFPPLPSPIKNRSMDSETSEIIEKLKLEKRILARKVLELNKNLTKIEQRFEEKFTKYGERIDLLEAKVANYVDTNNVKVEDLKKNEDKLAEDVSILEAEREVIAEKIKLADKTLTEIKDSIDKITFKFVEKNEPKDDEKVVDDDDNVNMITKDTVANQNLSSKINLQFISTNWNMPATKLSPKTS